MGPVKQTALLIWTICRRQASLGSFRNKYPTWDCGSEVQIFTHILQECPIWKPPWHLIEVGNPFLQNYLQNSNVDLSWRFFRSFFFSMIFFVYTNIFTVYSLYWAIRTLKRFVCAIYFGKTLGASWRRIAYKPILKSYRLQLKSTYRQKHQSIKTMIQNCLTTLPSFGFWHN